MSLLNFFIASINSGTVTDNPISFTKVDRFGGKDYTAFGTIQKINDTEYYYYVRNGTSHVLGGVVAKMYYNANTKQLTTQNVLTLASYQAQGITSIIIGGVIHLYISVYDGATFQGIYVYKSTDGLVGESFDSGTDLSSFLTYQFYNFYGKPFEVSGTFYITWYEHNGVDWRVNYLTTTDGVSHTNHNISDSPNPNDIGETSIIHIGGNNLLAVGRQRTGPYTLKQCYSNDLGATWSAWVDTNLGSGINQCMPELYLNKNGLIDCAYGDRGTTYVRISIDNPLTITTNPTSWATPKNLYQSDSGESFAPIGYPSMIEITQGRYLIFLSQETADTATNSEADTYYGDGHLNNL